MSDTVPLPVVPSGPGRSESAERTRPAGPQKPGRGLRALEAIAGLLSGGVLVLGVLLVASQLFAPSLLHGTGYATATGPGWWRVAAHLAVGLAGEAGVLVRRRMAPGARLAIAAGTVVAAVVVIAAAWWF